jgi:hypothetical protein
MMPHLSELQTKYGSDVVIVSVSTEDEREVTDFLSTRVKDPLSYRIAVDSKQATVGPYASAFNVRGIPHAFVIARDSTIRYSGHPAAPEFTGAIDKALADKPKADLKALSKADIEGMRIAELRVILKDAAVDSSQFVEKPEYVAAVLKLKDGK